MTHRIDTLRKGSSWAWAAALALAAVLPGLAPHAAQAAEDQPAQTVIAICNKTTWGGVEDVANVFDIFDWTVLTADDVTLGADLIASRMVGADLARGKLKTPDDVAATLAEDRASRTKMLQEILDHGMPAPSLTAEQMVVISPLRDAIVFITGGGPERLGCSLSGIHADPMGQFSDNFAFDVTRERPFATDYAAIHPNSPGHLAKVTVTVFDGADLTEAGVPSDGDRYRLIITAEPLTN